MLLEILIGLMAGVIIGMITGTRELKSQQKAVFIQNNYKFITIISFSFFQKSNQ